MSEEKIRVILKRPGKKAFTTEIPNTLDALQNEVGGWIEITRPFQDAAIICNEEGILLDLPANVRYGSVLYFGPIVIAGTVLGPDGEEFTDIPDGADGIVDFLNTSAEKQGLLH